MTPGRPPRVLVDATSVPADRGGVGRYVDGLLGALVNTSADIAVVCQRTDSDRYARELPTARVVAAPAAAAHRPARLAWEQTGLPLLAQQIGAEVLHSPFYTCPLRINCPVTVTVHEGPPVRVEVHDGVAATDAFREIVSVGGPLPDASAVSGRGLHLVRAMSTRVGLDDDSDGGKVVWFELDPDPPASRK